MNADHIPGVVKVPLGELPDLVSGGVGFVTDAHLADLPVVASVRRAIRGVHSIVIPVGEPSVEMVDVVAQRLVVAGTESVVAVGGGSVIDTVKLASLVAGNGGSAEGYLGVIGDADALLGVTAVPTTAGSGAEVTRTCVVSRGGRKSWAWSDRLRPRQILVDPELTCGLPRSATISGGLDAFVHALEAATAPGADPAAVSSGSTALETIFDALPGAVADGTDRSARSAMLDAALCAGFAIDLAGTGVGHAVGHALASMVRIPHGLAVAFGMWSCLEWGMEGADDRYRLVDAEGRLQERIGALLASIEFERELGRWAGHALDPVELGAELDREEHRPMCINNARPVVGDDVDVVARMASRAWNGLME